MASLMKVDNINSVSGGTPQLGGKIPLTSGTIQAAAVKSISDNDVIGYISGDNSSLVKILWSSLKSAIRSAISYLELGTGPSDAGYIDFHSGSITCDYDSRLISSGGNGTPGNGTLTVVGDFRVPTPISSDNSTKPASTAWVNAKLSGITAQALVNFNAVVKTGTYSQVGYVITVSMTSHGMTSGMIANLDFTSGTATDGIDFIITSVDANTFTVIGKTSVSTSGNVTRNLYIRNAVNISGIADNGVGLFTLYFANKLTNTNYFIAGSGTELTNGYTLCIGERISGLDYYSKTQTQLSIRISDNSTDNTLDPISANLIVF